MLSGFFGGGKDKTPTDEIRVARKIPRVFLWPIGNLVILPELRFHFGDQMEAGVLDLSLSGLKVPAKGLLSKWKKDQEVQGYLRHGFEKISVPLQVKVRLIGAQWIGLEFNSLSLQGRLQIDQTSRDHLTLGSLSAGIEAVQTPEILRAYHWFHSFFDTNIAFHPNLRDWIVEFDGILLQKRQDSVFLAPSRSVGGENHGYFWEMLDPKSARIEVGQSWPHRLAKLLDFLEQQKISPSLQSSWHSVRVDIDQTVAQLKSRGH